MMGKMAKMDRELIEVKEKLCTVYFLGGRKDEGQLNYKIKVILLNRKFCRCKHVLERERERERERVCVCV